MKEPVCQFESIEDHFNFGKYSGLTLADVLEINPSYIEWCVKKCDGVHFLIEAYNEMCDKFNSAQGNDYYQESYGRYAGSYAQDEMGYSDDDIDTIFDGDPDAYWNID